MPSALRHFERFKKTRPDRPEKRQANHEAERGRRAGIHIQKPEKIVRKKTRTAVWRRFSFPAEGLLCCRLSLAGG